MGCLGRRGGNNPDDISSELGLPRSGPKFGDHLVMNTRATESSREINISMFTKRDANQHTLEENKETDLLIKKIFVCPVFYLSCSWFHASLQLTTLAQLSSQGSRISCSTFLRSP